MQSVSEIPVFLSYLPLDKTECTLSQIKRNKNGIVDCNVDNKNNNNILSWKWKSQYLIHILVIVLISLAMKKYSKGLLREFIFISSSDSNCLRISFLEAK